MENSIDGTLDVMQFHHLLARQAGRFTRGQAHDFGFSSYRIARHLQSGEWRVVRGRVLALTAMPDTSESRDWEALLGAGDGAVLAGPSAARRLGVEVRDRRSCVLVPPARRCDVGDAVVLRHPVPDADLILRGGLLLTSRPATVVDCALLLPQQESLAFVERALQKRWISFAELLDRTQLMVGRKGVRRLVTVVRAVGTGARSAAERRLVAGLRRRGVRGWTCNLEVRDRRGLIGIVDIAFPALRLAVEVDGRAWHTDRDRFQRDRTRQNRLVRAGWTVLRFTWEDIAYRLDSVLAEIHDTVARLSAAA